MMRAKRKGRAVSGRRPKIGTEEFLAVAKRFGFSAAAMKRIAKAVSDDDLAPGGASLCRWYCATPKLVAGTEFEAAARALLGSKYALGVSSGTGALHAAFAAAGVGPGTEVICPAMGFVATAGAVVMAGGVPVFSDVDKSLHLDPAKIEANITPRTVAIAPTHHWGAQADMRPILRIARKHKLKVVEDCAQSPGGSYKGRALGTLGDLGCFSISAYKIVGAGEGGLVLTNNKRLYERACQLAEFGGLWRPDRFAKPRYDGELFVGTNYRMSELEAAVDVVQLGKLTGVVKRYRAARQRVVRALKRFGQITPQTINDVEGQVGYMLRFFPESASLGAKIAAALTAAGVPARCRGAGHGPDWHLSAFMFPVALKTSHVAGGSVFEDPRYRAAGGKVQYRRGDCPVSEDLFAREVSLSIDQWWTAPQCREVAATINRVLAEHCDEDRHAVGWA
jgi:dTDP-4-amino-4,6-dideoxygalactose transaminase